MPDYFTLDELRAVAPFDDETRFSDAACEAASAYVVSIIEREVGTSFVARTVTDEVHDGGAYCISLRRPPVLSVTSATESGVTVTDALSVDLKGGVLERFASGATSPGAWSTGRRNVKVTYQAGYSATPPGDIKDAALQATRYRLLTMDEKSTLSARKTTMSNESGTTTFAVAGPDRPTGLPEVDSVIVGRRDEINVLGFA